MAKIYNSPTFLHWFFKFFPWLQLFTKNLDSVMCIFSNMSAELKTFDMKR